MGKADNWSSGAYTRIGTWKRIAAYLGADPETAQTWAQQNDLPIHRLPDGDRGGVFAYTADLDRWMREELAKADGSGVLPGAADGAASVAHGGAAPAMEAAAVDGLQPQAGERLDIVPVAVAPRKISQLPELVADSRGQRGARGFLAAASAVFVAVLAAALLHSVEGVPVRSMPAAMWRSVTSSSMAALVPSQRVSASVALRPAAGANSEAYRPSPEAEELYLQGRYARELRTPESLARAQRDFSEAIRRDPSYARAYAGLADCYLLLRQYGRMSSAEAFPAAERAAQKAVALDGASSEAHRSMAFVRSYWTWDMVAAEREFQTALRLNPNDAETHHWYATSLMHRGRFREALVEINRARAIEPTSRAIVANRGLILLLSGEQEQGMAALRGVEETDPTFLMPHLYLADEYLRRGDDTAFLAEEQTLSRIRGDRELESEVQAARHSLKTGGHRLMLRTLALRAAARADGGGEAYRAAFYSMLSEDPAGAMRYLRLSHDRHEPSFLAIEDEMNFAPLRSNPEFRALSALADVHA